MPSFLINPTDQTVTPVEIDGVFLDQVRRLIGAAQVVVLPVPESRFAVWGDQMGLLKAGRSFWRFHDAQLRFAGTCLITGLSEDGVPMSLPPVAPERIAEMIVWYPSESLLSIDESVVVISDPEGNLVPAINRQPIWAPEEGAKTEAETEVRSDPPDEPSVGWSIYERDDGSYRAVRYRLRGEGDLEPMAVFTAADLRTARSHLPPGLTRIEPAENDTSDLVESWV